MRVNRPDHPGRSRDALGKIFDSMMADLGKQPSAKQAAIANADAQANNAGLPTYSELVAALKFLRGDCVAGVAADGYTDLREPGRKSFNETGALLARIPS